jgi:ABC-type transport system involved in Fe-S cluster assembly fused permease/ATPase subunit
MDLVIGIIFDVIATAALMYLFIFGYNSEYEAATIIAPVLIYIIWSRRAQMIKTRKWRESIEKQMKNQDEKES